MFSGPDFDVNVILKCIIIQIQIRIEGPENPRKSRQDSIMIGRSIRIQFEDHYEYHRTFYANLHQYACTPECIEHLICTNLSSHTYTYLIGH